MLEIINDYQRTITNNPLVFGVFEKTTSLVIDANLDEYLSDLIKKEQLCFKLGKINKVFTFGKMPNDYIYLIGLGKKEEYCYEKLEEALRDVNYKLGNELHFDLESFSETLNQEEVAKRMVETIGVYNYSYDECKTEKTKNDLKLKFISNKSLKLVLQEAMTMVAAVDNTRDLVNKPYNYLSAADLAEYALNLCESLEDEKVKATIYNKQQISEMGMNAFLGVNKGSTAEPKLIHLVYQNGNNKGVALVGKGVMYDTGGYSIKQSMNTMKDDMAGAATVLGVFELVVKKQLPINLHVVICATDNRINGEALLPDDVLTAMNKKTIEIVSTDAEGRLTLADAVCFAQKQGCNEVIDVATLTGAIVVALGEYVTGLFGNNQAALKQMLKAGKKANEEIWEMPINEYIRNQVRSSKVADLTNSTGRNMGASSAAAFIEAFIEKQTKWMHLDIAGTAFHTSPANKEPYGATGAMVKTIYYYLLNQ
ncbi:MAG: leucyl aminopeptidase [Bacilli bacterium]